jgi:hypothetical protein
VTLRFEARFALWATAAAAVGAVLLSPRLFAEDRLVSEWASKGFFAMALPGICGGVWLAHEHGRSGSRFLAALASGALGRLVLGALVAFGAARAGGRAIDGLLPGLAAGFVPVLLFEMIWFARTASGPAAGTESRG